MTWPLRLVTAPPPADCDHAPELAQLRQQVAALTAERNSLARDLAGSRRHLHLLADRLDEYRRADEELDRMLAPSPHSPVWLPEPPGEPT